MNLNDLTNNSELGSNGRYLVKSRAKENALNASKQIWKGGVVIVVQYGATNYVKITDGENTFANLNKSSEGTGGDIASVTGNLVDNSNPSNPVINITGSSRQVIGYDSNGNPLSVTLGWRQLSDLPNPPTFLNGVLAGTAFSSDGSALFAFVELALGDGGTSLAKPNAIPFYNPGQIGTGGGTLKVADGIVDGDAVNMKQFNALMARVAALENI